MKKLLFILVTLFSIVSCNKEAPAPLPVANFFADNNGCTAPCEVYFFDDSENAISWEWDFGNGLGSSLQNDTATYTTAGFYEVWLHVENADNVRDSIRKNITIK